MINVYLSYSIRFSFRTDCLFSRGFFSHTDLKDFKDLSLRDVGFADYAVMLAYAFPKKGYT